VLPLNGSATVTIDGERFELAGRESVFAALTDFAYAPATRASRCRAAGASRCRAPRRARSWSRATPGRPVPVELRGAGNTSRQVNNFCSPEAFEADALIAVEVLTPNGNWSSYPPHKHDEDVPGVEVALEEIYYFEVSGGGFAYQRVYGSGMDVLREVRSGDRIDMPRGYHGRRWPRPATTSTTST
jgi:5-deoxy-glucuronate isomerase